uniref:Putative extracellular protein TR9_015 n=1 Tax=Trebouxia lynnae TaxID=1825957 RepID=A0A7L9QEF0_9CHLO|nr:putative extracellular protein TR9_015 [Trebouxia lynnae]
MQQAKQQLYSTCYGLFWAIALCLSTVCSATNPLVPDNGAWVGVSIDWQEWASVNDYVQQAEFQPTSYTIFVSVPLNVSDKGLLDNVVPQIAALGGMAVIVAQPSSGLPAITKAAAETFAKVIAGYEEQGASMLIEFGHEMNGNWYPWGQKPTAYIKAFQTMSQAIYKACCRTYMLWSVNTGGGYPYPNGTDIASYTSSADFKLLDTNGDGSITMADDPYAPYYPGDDYVDWVGLSLYHFGTTYPYDQNVLPEARKFTSTIFGTFKTSYVDYTTLPNFYQVYSSPNGTHKKPMAIPETGSLWDLNKLTGGAPTELQVKQAWWQQLFNVGGDSANALDISVAMPNLRLVAWFDQKKAESSASMDIIDWRYSATSNIHDAFVAYIGTKDSSGNRYWNTLPQFISHIGKVTNTETASDGSTEICLGGSSSGTNGSYADPLANLGAASGAASSAVVMTVGGVTGALLLCMLLL